jgi:2-oxo-4-hydroxy-4-carboxy-5-ureidoimidazoline decarboxylase
VSTIKLRLAAVNALDREAFVALLGGIFEHSPWVAAAAWEVRPFASTDALHAAMVAAVDRAGEARQLELLRAHPELAGKAAIRGELTDDSAQEQASAGLDRCSPEEFARLQALNATYNAKFGFPFIVAVKGLDRASVLQQFAARLEHDSATEFREALAQVAKIARLRLIALIA